MGSFRGGTPDRSILGSFRVPFWDPYLAVFLKRAKTRKTRYCVIWKGVTVRYCKTRVLCVFSTFVIWAILGVDLGCVSDSSDLGCFGVDLRISGSISGSQMSDLGIRRSDLRIWGSISGSEGQILGSGVDLRISGWPFGVIWGVPLR